MGEGIYSIFAVCSQRPISMEDAETRGMELYCCVPCFDFDGGGDCTHYLSVLGMPGYMFSQTTFTLLAGFQVYSHQWLTYYRTTAKEVAAC